VSVPELETASQVKGVKKGSERGRDKQQRLLLKRGVTVKKAASTNVKTPRRLKKEGKGGEHWRRVPRCVAWEKKKAII